MKRLLIAVTCFAFVVSASMWADTINSSGQWNTAKVANNDTAGPTTYWDHVSQDGNHCNVGWVLEGLYGPCNNINVVNNSELPNQALNYLSANGNTNATAAFTVTPGPNGDHASYVASFAGNSGDNLRNHDVFGWALTSCSFVYNVPTNTDVNGCLHQLFSTFNDTQGQHTTFTPGGDFRYYIAVYNTQGNLVYVHFSNSVDDFNRNGQTPTLGQNYFALFSQTPPNPLGPPSNLSTYWVGAEDTQFLAGDFDFQDMLVQISAVPEPASLMLLGTGLVGLAGALRKKIAG